MRVGIVGCGSMAQAMLARWLQTGTLQRQHVVACTAREASAQRVTERLGIACGTDVAAAVMDVDVALIACKPQQRQAILAELAARRTGEGPLYVSVLAGVDLEQLRSALGESSHVVRWMPNTPVQLGAGLVAASWGANVTEADRETVAKLLQPLGKWLVLPEAELDAFTAIAGCGPAYVFRFVEALQAAAMDLGFSADVARVLAEATTTGAAQLLAASGRPASELRVQVTSKGGMTEAALHELGERGWDTAMTSAVRRALDRADVLAGRG